MREETRLRLREISEPLSGAKIGATGATDPVAPPRGTVLHRLYHLRAPEKHNDNQACSTVAPVAPPKLEGGGFCSTSRGATGGATDLSDGVQQALGAPQTEVADWLAVFHERAAILEFDGGHDRREAERLAFAETVEAMPQVFKG